MNLASDPRPRADNRSSLPARGIPRAAIAFLGWAALAVFAALVVIIGINLRDETPSPDARALSDAGPPDLPDARNAFLALLGLSAPADTTPVDEGARITAAHNAQVRDNPWNIYLPEREVAARGAAIAYSGDDTLHCDPGVDRCFSYALAHADELRDLRTANAVLVARYLAIQRMDGFAVTLLPSVGQPMSVGGSTVRRMLLTEAALNAQRGDARDALTFIGDDIRFWRMVLTGETNLIASMIAVGALSEDLHLLSEMISSREFEAGRYSRELRAILTPLTPRERSLARAFRNEFEMQAAMVRHVFDRPSGNIAEDEEDIMGKLMRTYWSEPQAHLFFKPQATVNLSASLFSRLVAVAKVEPAEFAAARTGLRRYIEAQGGPRLDMIYNPAGKLLAGTAITPYDEYVGRVFDLAAYLQLVRAQLEVRLARVSPQGISAFLALAGPETRNPYDGQPFTWNGDATSLSFKPATSRWSASQASVSMALNRH